MGLGPLLQAHNRWNPVFSCFVCLKVVEYSQYHLKSMFLNIFCPFVWEKSIILNFVYFFTFFAFYLEIMKNGVRYLVALTPSISNIHIRRGILHSVREAYFIKVYFLKVRES